MPILSSGPKRQPFITALLLPSLAAGLTFLTALPPTSARAQQLARVEPSLGWLGGESGSPALRAAEECNAVLKTGRFAKLDRHLAALYCNPAVRRSSELARIGRSPDGQTVVVDATASNPVRLAADLREIGARRVTTYGPVVSAQVPIARLDELATLPSLRFARSFAARTNTGSVTGQHVAALEVADLAASGFDGSGVSIGVLSDSYDCLGGAATDIANNDLPTGAIALLDEAGCASGTDEGRAMMQLVHDVVPAASQTFHTAVGGAASFANGIQALQVNGATVIVDDVIYFAEPMFQDGVIAQAVDSVVNANGVAYFSSAGNNGENSYESDFRDSGVAGPFGGVLHDFDPGSGVDTLQQLTVPDGNTKLILNWDQPYFSATGGAGSATDIDIHVYSGTTYLFSASDANIGADPIEILALTNTRAPAPINLAIEYFDGPSGPTPIPTFVKYVLFNDTTIDEFATPSGTAFGHSNAAGSITIGAANYWQTPAFGVDPAVVANYSSHGGVPIFFDLADLPIGPVDRGKPEIVGPDGANTTFFGSDITHATDPDSFPNFFGTSASASVVATVAAMMQQARPTITPAEVELCLTRTAADMGAPGFDAENGHGYVRAEAALACANGDWGDLPDAPYPTLEASDSARHVLDGATRIGALVDRDGDGQPNAAGTDDDDDGTDDEDGVTFVTPLIPGRMATIEVATTAGYLSAFIDFDGNGVLDDAGEILTADQAVAAGTTSLAFTVPAGAVGLMPARFRLTASAGEGGAQSTGPAASGEVEDYVLARLGNQVWEDQDRDGSQEAGELPVAGVTVELLDPAQNPILDGAGAPITRVSDGSGIYLFTGLPDGSYRVRATPPVGFGFTLHNSAAEEVDSDVDPASGVSDAFAVSAGVIEDRLDIGFALLDTTPPAQATTLTSTSHTVSIWSSLAEITTQWSGATDANGVVGYSVVFDNAATTDPDTTVDVPETGDPHSTTSATQPDGIDHWFHLRACDAAGNCSATQHLGSFLIDSTAPTNPAAVTSTSHTVSTPSNDTAIDMSWAPGTDVASGVDGYAFAFNNSTTPVCDQTKDLEETATTVTSGTLVDGDWWFHLCTVDNTGNWTSAVAVGPFSIDATAPIGPASLASTSHTVGSWSALMDVAVEWSGASDAGGLDGYSVLFDLDPGTTPDATVDVPHTTDPHSTLSGDLPDGEHWFHLRSCDAVGNCTGADHLGPFLLEATAPSDPATVQSTSHTVGTPSGDLTIDMTWDAATDATSGVDGYAFEFNQGATTVCDQSRDLEETDLGVASSLLGDGDWWFHICTVDNAGNWSAGVTVGPYSLDELPPQVAAVDSVVSADPVSGLPPGAAARGPVTQLLVTFNEQMDLSLVTDPASFELIAAGSDGLVQTSECANLQGDDTLVLFGSAEWDEPSLTVALKPVGDTNLETSRYRLLACATLADEQGNALDGDADGTGGDTFRRNFLVVRTDRFANPNFDVDLDGWTTSSPTGTGIDWDVEDLDAAATSGSLFVNNIVGPDAVFSATRCVDLDPGDIIEVGGALRMMEGPLGTPRLRARVGFYVIDACAGALGDAVDANVLEGGTGGAWQPFLLLNVSTPIAAESAQVTFDLEANGDDQFQAWLDALFVGSAGVVFEDGFESGDTSAWSSTVP